MQKVCVRPSNLILLLICHARVIQSSTAQTPKIYPSWKMYYSFNTYYWRRGLPNSTTATPLQTFAFWSFCHKITGYRYPSPALN
jgi:hypothetical protein